MSKTKKIAIFASGSGSNAEVITNHFKGHKNIEVAGIYTNKQKAFVIERAKKLLMPYFIFNRNDFYNTGKVEKLLVEQEIDFIVLAGFLWLVPGQLVKMYKDRILNIHPALLPKYGGKGMYGDKVHQAVFANKETETGITIHKVNEKYDEGDIVFQKSVEIESNDTPGSIAEKVHKLEYKWYSKVIEQFVGSCV